MPAFRDRRRAQAGTTLVELLVSMVIIGLVLVLVVGALSDGLLDSYLSKRNTASQAVAEFEIDKVGASAFNSNAAFYSDCFATESAANPAPAAWQGACPSGAYTLRADVSWASLQGNTGVQVWTIKVTSVPSGSQVGGAISVYKVAYR